MKKAKARFRVGEVVCIRKGYMHAGLYGRIMLRKLGKDNFVYCLSAVGECVEFAIRPLTAREIGPRADRRKGNPRSRVQ